MKTKYLALAGLVGIATAVYYFKFRKGSRGNSIPVTLKKQTVQGEEHIREIMKKSKLAV